MGGDIGEVRFCLFQEVDHSFEFILDEITGGGLLYVVPELLLLSGSWGIGGAFPQLIPLNVFVFVEFYGESSDGPEEILRVWSIRVGRQVCAGVEVGVEEVVVCPGVVFAFQVIYFGEEDSVEVEVVFRMHNVVNSSAGVFELFSIFVGRCADSCDVLVVRMEGRESRFAAEDASAEVVEVMRSARLFCSDTMVSGSVAFVVVYGGL